ncbi:MAG: site-specific integrase [Actinomycetota bacterium]|nr:site-specific integrase [Actinomycetota bacterium]
MTTRTRTSGFGHVEKLDSGRWRARYTGPDGRRRSSTFGTKTDARRWLATAQTDLVRRAWKAPEGGRRTLGAYATDYLARADLRESTRQLYEGVWRLHLKKTWSSVAVGDVTPQQVRLWHEAAARTARPTALVQSYRLLRALLNVAVADEVLATNPCRLRAAGIAKSARPSRALTVAEVQALAGKVPARYRALVLTLAFGGLRFGEATALRRRDVSADGVTVTVTRSVKRVGGSWLVGPPKTEAGVRTVALPAFVAAAVAEHLDEHVDAGPTALVFGTSSGTFLAGSNFNSTFRRAVDACGLDPVRIHELRHTGATLAAATGASTKDLMHRLGHSSPAAALIYQHASTGRDSEIARALDALVTDPKVVALRPRRKSTRTG